MELNTTGVANIAILDLSKAISRKLCKIGGKLVLITNRKLHMSFLLVLKSVTLNDLERRNGRCVISTNSVAFGAHCLKVAKSGTIPSSVGTEEGTFLRAKFHPHRCNVSPLRGEKPQNQPLSNLNTCALRFAHAMLPVTTDFEVRVRYRRKRSSRSLSHFLVSFLF